MTDAFISMGLQEKFEAIKMELSRSTKTPDNALSPSLKEKVDRLAHEFNQALSCPGYYLGLKQKLETLTEASRLIEQQKKAVSLKKEINEKLQGQMRGKMEILRKAREKVAKGEQLDESTKEEVEKAKEEMEESLKLANLEVVGLSKKISQADELIWREIKRAINMGGLRENIAKLKEELRNTNQEKVEELQKEIREGIVAVMDSEELKKKLENLTTSPQVLPSPVMDNGRM